MIVGVVQARMGSTRLANKVMADIVGRPMLWHIVDRLRWAQSLDQVVVATSIEPRDAPIREFADKHQIPYFAGSELDVVGRLSGTAQQFHADAVVRITGDCPLVDPQVVDRLVDVYLAHDTGVDYVTNEMPPTYPHGLDTEVYSAKALERLCAELEDPFWREWFVPYLQNHRESFRAVNVTYPEDLSSLRWTVDYPEDLEFIRAVYQELYQPGRPFGMQEVLGLVREHPEIQSINAKYAKVRNEAYQSELQALGLEDKGFLNVG